MKNLPSFHKARPLRCARRPRAAGRKSGYVDASTAVRAAGRRGAGAPPAEARLLIESGLSPSRGPSAPRSGRCRGYRKMRCRASGPSGCMDTDPARTPYSVSREAGARMYRALTRRRARRDPRAYQEEERAHDDERSGCVLRGWLERSRRRPIDDFHGRRLRLRERRGPGRLRRPARRARARARGVRPCVCHVSRRSLRRRAPLRVGRPRPLGVGVHRHGRRWPQDRGQRLRRVHVPPRQDRAQELVLQEPNSIMTIRRRRARAFGLGMASGVLFVLTSGAMATEITPAVRSEIAPSGKLRVGLNHGNFLLVTPGSSATEPRGVAPDVARELGRRVGVPVEFIKFDTAGKLGDGAKSGAWDVAFLGAEPQRAAEIAFTAAYLEIPSTYLVPAGSPIRSLAEVDREGVRIAVADQSAYGLYLARTIKHAKLVMTQGLDSSFDVFVSQKLEALAGLKPRLLTDVQKLPGARILDGQFTAVQQAIGTPKNREASARFLRAFVEEVKASGLVAAAISRNGAQGVTVAPPAPAR